MNLVRNKCVQRSARSFPRLTARLFKDTRLPLEPQSESPLSASNIVAWRFHFVSPLTTYLSSESAFPRISLVTDSVSPGSLFGGVGTAIIFATLLAEARSARLRLITRREPVQPAGVEHVLRAYGLELCHEPQFEYVSDVASKDIDRQPDELFITTSWWTTASALAGVPPRDVLYLLQEDERMFYPHGDDLLRCQALLSRRDIRTVVNTRLLFDHLVGSGLSHLAESGQWFEPAFPPSLFYPRPGRGDGKRRLLFYARPKNLRNLFHLGVEVLDEAVRRGVLDLDRWEVILVGRDIPAMTLGDTEPRHYTNLPWHEYARLVGQVDAGLCLMATPHPSYPPLDLAASGAVVLTNTFGNKQDLSSYCTNIVCADPDVESLVCGLEKVLLLAEDIDTRQANFADNRLLPDWREAFSKVLERVEGGE